MEGRHGRKRDMGRVATDIFCVVPWIDSAACSLRGYRILLADRKAFGETRGGGEWTAGMREAARAAK